MPLLDPLLPIHISEVEVQQSTESFATNDGAVSGCGQRFTVDQGVRQPLMVSLVMIVRHCRDSFRHLTIQFWHPNTVRASSTSAGKQNDESYGNRDDPQYDFKINR